MMTTFRRPTDLLFALNLIILGMQGTHGSGRIEIHFLRYEASCEEHFGLVTSLCDPEFSFCLGDVQNEPLSVDDCRYASVGESDHFHDTNHIDFEDMTDIGGLANPWIVYVPRFEAASLMLVIEARDADSFSGDDHLQTWGMELRETVWPSKSQSGWTRHTMSKNGYSIVFKIRMYCDPNYYTVNCDKYCEPHSSELGHYTCHPGTGDKICQAGKNCSTALDPCYSQPCQNGGACFSRHDGSMYMYMCMCTDGWEGESCEARSDPCNKKPCMNGGSCHSSPDKTAYQCTCVYPYIGYHCQSISSTTTSTSTTTTTTAATTTTTTRKPTTSKTTSTSPKPTTRQTTTTASTTTVISEGHPLSRKTSTFGPSKSITTNAAGINSSGQSSGDGFQTWHGLLIGFILLVLIVFIGLLVVFIMRKQTSRNIIPKFCGNSGSENDERSVTIRQPDSNPALYNGSSTRPKRVDSGRPATAAHTIGENMVSGQQSGWGLAIVNPSVASSSTDSVT